MKQDLKRININENYSLIFWIVICLLFIWRLIFIKISGFDLSPDEAYYWDWSRHLAWGYYSKPPLVAWIIAFSCKIFGTSTFTVRLPAAFLSVGSLLWLFLLAKDMFGQRAGLLAVILSILTPGSCVLGFIMTIDPPLMFFWSLSLYLLWKAIEKESLLYWIATGIAAAFGLLAKQTMIAFLPIIFFYLYLYKRDKLKSLGPYLVVIIVCLAITPTLIWNAHHQWITFKHTAHHFEEGGPKFHLELHTLFEFIGTQLIVFSPITWILMIFLFIKGVKYITRDKKISYLLLFSLLPLIPVFLLSLKQRVNANWPAPFYIAGFVLIGAYLSNNIFIDDNKTINKKFILAATFLVGFIFTAFTYSIPWSINFLGIKGTKLDPTIRIRGWRELGKEAYQVLRPLSKEHPGIFVMAYRRQTTSELAFYLPSRPHVYCYPGSRVTSQYDIWPGPKKGKDALIFIESDEHIPFGLHRLFKGLERLCPIKIPLGAQKSRAFKLFLGKQLIFWPKLF